MEERREVVYDREGRRIEVIVNGADAAPVASAADADAPLLMLLLWLEFSLYGLVVKKIQSPPPGGARAGR